MNLAAWFAHRLTLVTALLLAVVLLLVLVAIMVVTSLDGVMIFARQAVAQNADWTPVFNASPLGIEFVLVPAGCFRMGDAADREIRDGGEQCFAEPFWISRYEITNAQYNRCVTAGICEAPRCTEDPAFNGPDQPVVCVNWFQAQTFARWMKGSLPSEAQWEYVARGPDRLVYPWGSDPPGCAVTNLTGCNEATVAVGSFSPAGDSWVGAGELTGNVAEWTSTIFRAYPYDTSDGREDTATNNVSPGPAVRGGSWRFDFSARTMFRYGQDPNGSSRSLGFRLVITALRFN